MHHNERPHGRPRSPAAARAFSELSELERLAGTTTPTLSGPPRSRRADDVIYHGRRVIIQLSDWEALGWPPDEAEQYARQFPAHTPTEVVVISSAGSGLLTHYRYHSEGFDWGYGGSSPAELARCLLLDHYKVTPPKHAGCYPPTASELPVDYQRFKRDVVAAWAPASPWALTTRQIHRWAAGRT